MYGVAATTHRWWLQGLASAEDIDKGCKLGTNVPMGPLRLADFIGQPSPPPCCHS
jgi:3-hydroxybutyryl-CoA dehydrogenase